MSALTRIALLLGLLLLPTGAEAATCFWVGGTGTWDNSTDAAFWKSSTGGGTACAATGGVPKNAGDVATFDGASGGGTVTVNVNISIGSIVCGAFTGTWNNSAHNNSITLSANTAFNCSGTGTRTINLGSATYTMTSTAAASGPWAFNTITGLTLSAASATIDFSGAVAAGAAQTFTGGAGQTYGTLKISGARLTSGLSIASTGTIGTFTNTAA